MTLNFLGFLLIYVGIIGATLCVYSSNQSLREREDTLQSLEPKGDNHDHENEFR